MDAKDRLNSSALHVYMMDISLPSDPPEEFFSSIPAQRMHVNGLMEVGVISSYSLARDRSRLWVTIHAASEKDVLELIAEFPLIRWMEVEIQELMFNDTVAPLLPPVSLN